MTYAAPRKCSVIIVLPAKIVRSTWQRADGLRLRLGVALLLLNFPFGYGSLLLGSMAAIATQNSRWLFLGTAGYALSWLMLAGGTALVGYEAKDTLFKNFRRKWAAWQKLNQRR